MSAVTYSLKIILILPLVLLIYSYFGEPVTSLPLGMEEAVTFFSQTVHGVLTLMPWFQTPFDLLIWAITIKIMLLSIGFFRWIISLLFAGG